MLLILCGNFSTNTVIVCCKGNICIVFSTFIFTILPFLSTFSNLLMNISFACFSAHKSRNGFQYMVFWFVSWMVFFFKIYLIYLFCRGYNVNTELVAMHTYISLVRDFDLTIILQPPSKLFKNKTDMYYWWSFCSTNYWIVDFDVSITKQTNLAIKKSKQLNNALKTIGGHRSLTTIVIILLLSMNISKIGFLVPTINENSVCQH